MRILVAPDKFKGSLGAAEVAGHIAAGLREVLPAAEITCLPIADGGEGTARVICDAAGGEWHICEAHDPLDRTVTARYCTIDHGATAVMEMSEVSGLWRLAPDERDPLRASTFGTGEMLLAAAKRGVRTIIIGLGGSATNDGGMGMARALGFNFLDPSGEPTKQLRDVARVVAPNELSLPPIVAAVDVRNPLLGHRGATRTFASQKGATSEQVEWLEESMTHFAQVVGGEPDCPGAGAAGGLGFSLRTFLGAELRPGFDVVAERISLREAAHTHDVVITGEGRLDAQTLEGKAPAGLAKLAHAAGKRVFAIVGAVTGASELFERVFVVGSLEDAPALLRDRAKELAQLLR